MTMGQEKGQNQCNLKATQKFLNSDDVMHKGGGFFLTLHNWTQCCHSLVTEKYQIS